MILEEIRLTDFRCFYGESAIRFSTDDEKNVTLIYAENGVGKTTLLNALLWCFYGETTARFEKREDILNYDAKREGRDTASVEVHFEHNDSQYIAKRFFRSSASNRDGREFIVQRIDIGSQTPIEPPDVFINTVIPKDMAWHFLFDGEHAEVFLGESNKSSIRNAVRDILGCSLIETAIDDLQAISSQFRKQMPSSSATVRIDEINKRIDHLVTQEEQAKKHVAKLEKDKALTQEQMDAIDEKLRTSSAAKELQRSRDRLTEQLARAQRRQKEFKEEVFRWLGENGRFVVSKRISEETFSFLQEKEHRGRIPSPYNEEFVKDVLAAETCICGAHLAAGSEAARRVSELLQKAANQVMRDRISKVRARLSNLKSERSKAPLRLETANKRFAEANEEFSSTEAQLQEIHDKLKGIDLDDIALREQRREELRKELSQIDQGIGSLRTGLQNSERERGALDRELNELAKLDKQTALFAKRRSICEEVKQTLERQLNEEEAQAQKVLRASISKILSATTRKVLNLKMTNDYVISLVNSDGLAMPKSSGENQLLGLAFTAALVEFAKVRKNARNYKLLPGTIAPLVLDSPFGQIDDAYRATTAEFIPKMARQVILLVSSSQGTSEVFGILQQHLGAEYLLVRHNKGANSSGKTETRLLQGKKFKTAIFDSSFDGTEIKEVMAK